MDTIERVVKPAKAERKPKVKPLAPGIDIQCIANIPGDKQIVLRTMVLQDTFPDELDMLMDRMLGHIDRQAAKYSLERLEKEFAQVGLALTTIIAGLPIAEKNYIAEREKLLARLADQDKAYGETHAGGEAEWRKSGRSGEYEPIGRVKENLNRIVKAGRSTKEQIQKLVNERNSALDQALQAVQHHRGDLAERRDKINELRRMSDKPPIEGFDDVMTCELPKLEALAG